MPMKSVDVKKPLALVLIGSCLVCPPLAGILISGLPLGPYLAFPPMTRYVEHAPFSWTAFVTLAVFELLIVLYIAKRILATGKLTPTVQPAGRVRRFPVWGWFGVMLAGVSWILAWSRFGWFEPLQRHTFTPLWIGFILIVNGLSTRRKGSCLLTANRKAFLWLFPLSGLFWWLFEYLNRFVQNWYYLGVEEFTPLEYALLATLSFATVLPAVMSTLEWLTSYRLLNRSFTGLRSLKVPGSLHLPAFSLVLAIAAGMAVGIWPAYLFPLIWIAPLIVITSVQALFGLPSAFEMLRYGDWRPVFLPGFAALFCGFFWELWNFHSLAHWEYAIPHGGRFHLFEMPLLGYAFYLPFGLVCLAAVSLFQKTGDFFPTVID